MDDDSFLNMEIMGFSQSKIHVLTEFLTYHEQTEVFWQKEQLALQKLINEKLKLIPQDEQSEYLTYYGYDLHVSKSLYPSLHRESTIVTIHSYVENSLNIYSELVRQCVKSKLKLRHINGAGIERAKIYLSIIGGVNFSHFGDTWTFIKDVNVLRNGITHGGGVIDNDNNKLYQFVYRCDYLEGSKGQNVVVKRGFIELYIHHVINFFSRLSDDAPRLIEMLNK